MRMRRRGHEGHPERRVDDPLEALDLALKVVDAILQKGDLVVLEHGYSFGFGTITSSSFGSTVRL